MKTGIVLEGGAFRGLFTAGALDCLMDNQIVFDYVVGVSAGAENAAAFDGVGVCKFGRCDVGRDDQGLLSGAAVVNDREHDLLHERGVALGVEVVQNQQVNGVQVVVDGFFVERPLQAIGDVGKGGHLDGVAFIQQSVCDAAGQKGFASAARPDEKQAAPLFPHFGEVSDIALRRVGGRCVCAVVGVKGVCCLSVVGSKTGRFAPCCEHFPLGFPTFLLFGVVGCPLAVAHHRDKAQIKGGVVEMVLLRGMALAAHQKPSFGVFVVVRGDALGGLRLLHDLIQCGFDAHISSCQTPRTGWVLPVGQRARRAYLLFVCSGSAFDLPGIRPAW